MSKFEHGFGMMVDPGSDVPLLEEPSTQCVHCGGHFPLPSFGSDPKSKKLRVGRGFCTNCNGFVCGEKCIDCVPWEKRLEIDEGTLNPTAVSVGSIVNTSKLWLPE